MEYKKSKKCIDCGQLHTKGERCKKCSTKLAKKEYHIKSRGWRTKFCIDCGKPHQRGKRCTSCSEKHNYDRQKRKTQICEMCGKITSKNATLCKKCSWIKREKEMTEEDKQNRKGEKCHSWKGDDVGYHGLHNWIRKIIPRPQFCQLCNQNPPCDIANKTGIYSRDLNNWFWLCRRCHILYDMKPKKKKSITNCPHTERKHFAIGMCCACYRRKRREKQIMAQGLAGGVV